MKRRLNAKGMGLIEVMVSVVLLAITILASMMLVSNSLVSTKYASTESALQVVRTNVMNILQSDLAWYNTVQDGANTNLSCLQTPVDCSTQSGSFILHDASNTSLYNLTSATSGFDLNGGFCTTFDAVTGNAACPIHLNLIWQPVCPGYYNPCLNPQEVFTGVFTVNSGQAQIAINSARFNFSFTRQNVYCAPRNSTVGLIQQAGSVTVSGNSVTATASGSKYPVGLATSTVDTPICQIQSISFQYSIGYSGGLVASDGNNRASVCLFAASDLLSSPTCIFEWVQNQGVWSLNLRGASVYTSLPAETITAIAVFQFSINNGQVSFYYNYNRRHIFSESFSQPLRLAVSPASTSFSPLGVINILFQ